MSVRLMAEVFELAIPPSPKLLLLALADFADDEGGNVFPSVATMVTKSSVPERTVQRHLAAFRKRRVLVEVEPAGFHRPARYHLDLAPLKGATVAPLLNGCQIEQRRVPSSGVQSVSKDPSGNKRGRTRLPEDWGPTPELIAYARKMGVFDVSAQVEKFSIHHRAKGNRYERWDLAFQGWCRNAKDMRANHQRVERPIPGERDKPAPEVSRMLAGIGRPLP